MRAGTKHVADANRRRNEMCHFWITARKIPAHPLPLMGDIEMTVAACAFSWLLLIKNESSKPNKSSTRKPGERGNRGHRQSRICAVEDRGFFRGLTPQIHELRLKYPETSFEEYKEPGGEKRMPRRVPTAVVIEQ